MEQKSYVKARMGAATAERGDRAKRYFEITEIGQAQLNKSVRVLNSMLEDLPGIPAGVFA